MRGTACGVRAVVRLEDASDNDDDLLSPDLENSVLVRQCVRPGAIFLTILCRES